MKIFSMCKPYLLSHKITLFFYVLIIMSSAVIAVATPYLIGDFIDSLIEGAGVNAILRFCLIFGGLSLLKIGKGYITTMMYIKMQTRMGYAFNKNILKYIQNISLSFSNKQDNAYLNQRVNADTNNLIGFCVTILQSILTNIIILMATFIILFIMNPWITIFMFVFLVLYVLTYFAFKKPLYNAGMQIREAQANFFAKLYEQLKYIRLIKMNVSGR